MKCVIMGAGKIARGFIGHLLYLNEIPFTFVEKFDGLVDLINERGQYTVNILGNSEKNCVVKNAKAIHFSQIEEIAEAIAEATVVFTSVGGKNLGEFAQLQRRIQAIHMDLPHCHQRNSHFPEEEEDHSYAFSEQL